MIWKNLRIEEVTMEELAAYRLRLEAAGMRTPSKYPPWLRGRRISLSDTVRFLVQRQMDSLARARRMRPYPGDEPGQRLLFNDPDDDDDDTDDDDDDDDNELKAIAAHMNGLNEPQPEPAA